MSDEMQQAVEIVKRGPGQPLKFPDPKIIEDLGNAYLDKCEAEDKPLTITGLAIAIGTHRKGLMEYEERDGYGNTIKKLKARCERYAEQRGWAAGNPAFAIFALKNYGWTDKVDINVDATYKLSYTPEQLAELQALAKIKARQDAQIELPSSDDDR